MEYTQWKQLTPELKNQRRNAIAKSYLSSPSLPNIGRAVYAYFGGYDPENPLLMLGTPPDVGVGVIDSGIKKARSTQEALAMVKAMKAQKEALRTQKTIANRASAAIQGAATRQARGTAGGGTPHKLEEIPDIPNYLELYDTFKMSKASRLNLNNVLDKLPETERANVLKVIMSDPEHYLSQTLYGNITPSKAGSMIRTIRMKLPGEYIPLRVKSLDQTHHSMRSRVFDKFVETDNSFTTGWKQTTKLHPD